MLLNALSGALLSAGPAETPDATPALPSNYKIIFENECVRVVRVHYGPHESLPVHSHSNRPTVYVYLSDSPPVEFRHVEEPPFALIRPPQKMGACRVSPGRLEVHTVENLGDTAPDFLRVELNQIPLGLPRLFYRGSAPPDTSTTRLAEQYVRPRLVVERIIAANGGTVQLDHPERRSLLVAFTAAEVNHNALAARAVQWITPGQPAAVSGPSRSAHVLRIELPD